MTDGRSDHFVEFKGVRKTYDGHSMVVKNLDLDIREGEFLTLLGPSGSGKTTTLMMLAGFEVPTHGRILLDGRAIDNVPPHKRDIGMVFQNYALFPHMTVEENLAFPMKVRRVDKAETGKRVARALEMVQLGHLGQRRPGQLSGGQQQRVALARALVFEPKLVLMDEPLGALDKQLREHMQMEIKQIHRNLGVTVVYVTHDQGEALTMSDRVAVFNDGVIQQLAPPADLYERPQNAFVAQFIGENNRLVGRIVARDDTSCLVEIEGGWRVEATPTGATGTGDVASLSLRPERVRIGAASADCINRFEARVEELIYFGDATRVRVAVCGIQDFIVKVPNSGQTPDLTPGDVISIGWRREDCHALDAGS